MYACLCIHATECVLGQTVLSGLRNAPPSSDDMASEDCRANLSIFDHTHTHARTRVVSESINTTGFQRTDHHRSRVILAVKRCKSPTLAGWDDSARVAAQIHNDLIMTLINLTGASVPR